MTSATAEIVILIPADEEWKIVKELVNHGLPQAFSPFGEWFPHKIDVQGSKTTVVFFRTGCGKIPAAAATQYVLDRWQPPVIVNLGTCGGFKGLVKRGDILLVTKTVVYDIYERAGHNDEQIAKYATKLDLSWLEKPYPLKAQPATIATADQDLDPKIIDYLNQKYGAVAADWESGAIAFVADKNNNTKYLIVRGVSDVVDPSRGRPSSEKNIIEGTKIVIRKLIDSLPEWIAKVT